MNARRRCRSFGEADWFEWKRHAGRELVIKAQSSRISVAVGGRCGVTQLDVRELLIASHILPWGTHIAERLNVRNGLSLSRLHDAAFDQGLITFDDSLCLVISPRLKAALPQRAVAENFGAYAGQPLCLPDDAALPEMAFLAEHRTKKFRKT